MIDFEKILNKKKFTGKDLGCIDIASKLVAYNEVKESNCPFQFQHPPVDPNFIRNEVKNLSEEEYKVYRGYLYIQQWINLTQPLSLAQAQQVDTCYYRLLSFVENATTAEDIYNYIEELPLIVTSKEYNEQWDKRFKERTNPAYIVTYSVLDLIFIATDYYLKPLFVANPPNFYDMFFQLEHDKPVTDPHILDKWKKDKAPTKWQIIQAGNLGQYYDTKDPESLKAFINEFPEVKNRVLQDFYDGHTAKKIKNIQDIKKKVSISELRLLDPEALANLRFSWKELYDNNFYDFRAKETNDQAIFKDYQRALKNGVAVLKYKPDTARIDQFGDYNPPSVKNTLRAISLEAFFTKDDQETNPAIELVAQARSLLMQSIYFLKGFNLILDWIAKMYGPEEVLTIKAPMDGIQKKVDNLNKLIIELYQRIQKIDYDDPELKAKKLEVLRLYFRPFNLSKLTIPPRKIRQAKENMKYFRGFMESRLDPYIQVCYYDPRDQPKELFMDLDKAAANTIEKGAGQ